MPDISFNQCTDGWFRTFTGRKFYPTAPTPDMVCLPDIAHALSLMCRFGGHVNRFYSIGQHSLLAEEWQYWCLKGRHEPHLICLQTLMHDFTEAYCQDIVRPLKYQLVGYAEIEARLATAISEALGVPEPDEQTAAIIKLADNTMLMTERRDLFNYSSERNSWWAKEPLPWDKPIALMSAHMVEATIISRFNALKEICRL